MLVKETASRVVRSIALFVVCADIWLPLKHKQTYFSLLELVSAICWDIAISLIRYCCPICYIQMLG